MNSEWWRGCVMYQIYPRSFCDSNGNGVGDLKGIISKLDHVASLGAEAVWISPFFKSPMRDYGYDISDYKQVDPLFGDINDFKELLDYAHKIGIKVIIDQVYSHTSDEHAWFVESRMDKNNSKADWYVWADPQNDGTAPNNWISCFGGPAWSWDARREQYYLHHFLNSQPNLNLHNSEVRQALKDTASFWLDLGVDGFRLDATQTYIYDKKLRSNPPLGPNDKWPDDVPKSNPLAYQKRIYSNATDLPGTFEWIEEFRNHVDQWPNKCLLAEVAGEESDKYAAAYVQPDNRFHMAYAFGLVGSKMTKQDIVSTIAKIEENIDKGWICWSTSNHDYKRSISRINDKFKNKEDLARYVMALGLCLRGSICIYQGEELGLPQAELTLEELVDPYDISLYPEHVGRDGCRTPMPWVKDSINCGFSTTNDKTWLPIPPEHNDLAVDTQNQNQKSVLNDYKKIIEFRKNSNALRIGDIELIHTKNDVLFFIRTHSKEKIACIFNTSDKEEIFESKIKIMPIDYLNNNLTIDKNTVILKPYSYGLFEVQND